MTNGLPEQPINIQSLRLDDENARLPEHLWHSSQAEILTWLYEEGVLEELALSFLDHGYLAHEPLFVALWEEGSDEWRVLEGNRRLAALMILTQEAPAREAELQFRLQVVPTSDQLERLQTVPCRIADSRDDLHEFVGFRHIGGIKEWPAEAKARWIEREIPRRTDSSSESVFADIARAVGTNAQSIRGPYLALRLVRFAREESEADQVAAVDHVQRNRFGVLVRATNSPHLRKYIAPTFDGTAPRSMDDIATYVRAIDVPRLMRVVTDMTPQRGRRTPVLSDSRDVTAYARALVHPVASRVLEDYGDLALARQIIEFEDVPERLRQLESSLRVILEEVQRDLRQELPLGTTSAARGVESAARSLVVQLQDRDEVAT